MSKRLRLLITTFSLIALLGVQSLISPLTIMGNSNGVISAPVSIPVSDPISYPKPDPHVAVNYSLKTGWNSIGMSVYPNMKPDQILAATNYNCVVLAGINPLSQNLELYTPIKELGVTNTLNTVFGGYGYFIYCLTDANLTVKGLPVVDNTYIYSQVSLVALPFNHTMSSQSYLINLRASQSNKYCPAVAKYNQTTQKWDTVNYLGSSDNVFSMKSTEGYLVLCQ